MSNSTPNNQTSSTPNTDDDPKKPTDKEKSSISIAQVIFLN